MSREAYEEAARQLLACLDDLEQGRPRSDAALTALLDRLLIRRQLTHDHRTRREATAWLPSDVDLLRVAADLCPAGGAEAVDRVLGPLGATLDARRADHRRTLQVALAAYAFIVPDGELRQAAGPEPQGGAARARGIVPGQTPFELWTRRKPEPPVEARAAFRAIERAPWAPWILRKPAGPDRWWVEPMLPLEPRDIPVGAVLVAEPASPIRAARAGDVLLARIVEGPHGWEARTALVFPGGPSAARVQSWVRLELVRGRLVQRLLTVEASLRKRGFVLARRLCEWAWLHGDDDPYAHPELYDLEYREHDEDIDWYVDLAVRHGGPVLELGCGTGRLSLALARAAVEVHGVDISDAMLGALEDKVARQPLRVRQRIRWSRGDYRTLEMPAVHPLVIVPFNALHHCRDVDELVAALTCARRALSPGGRLAFDVYLPDLDLYDRDPDTRHEPRTFTHPLTGQRLSSWEEGWWDADARVHHVVYVYETPDGRQTRSHLQLRMFERAEILAAVEAAGLRVLIAAQDFEGTPMDERALKFVLVTAAA